ncbi:MAG TPA: EAL domain-containing protein [Vibrio sp.]|nr:EAL domain-containing protein [Vibrio sp.]
MLLSSHDQFQQCVSLNDTKRYVANYKELCLTSVFQPIFDRENRTIGVEALVRISTDEKHIIRPDQFFNSVQISLEDKINVERLSRVIHIRNFSQSPLRDRNLFLNVLPSSGEFYAFEDMRINLLSKRLKSLNLTASQLVMEVVELEARNETCLQKAMHRLSSHGFKIAVDDFGMHASNRKRVEMLKPHIIKIDRSLLLTFMDGKLDALLSGIALARKVGAKVVVEGIETIQQYQAMMELDVDLFQGYYLAMPKPLEVNKSYTLAAL